MSTPEVVDSTAAEELDAVETGVALAIAPTPAVASIIRAESPTEVIAKATEIADALKGLIDGKGLSTNVGGNKKHVNVEGWQALGAMLGALGGEALHAETVWTRPVRDDEGKSRVTSYTATVRRYHSRANGGGLREEITYDVLGLDWEACVEVRTASGVLTGRAEAMCSREEATWSTRDEFALRSMAETRAESRAYRRAAGWIVSIAGYSPTPSEEMPPQQQEPAWTLPANDQQVSGAIIAALTAAGVPVESQNSAGQRVWDAIPTTDGGSSRPEIAVSILTALARQVSAVHAAARQGPAAAPQQQQMPTTSAPDTPAPTEGVMV